MTLLGLLDVLHDRSELGVRDLVGLPPGGGLQGPPHVGGELGVGQAQEVDYDVLDGFGELDHGHCDGTVAWVFGCLEGGEEVWVKVFGAALRPGCGS